MQLACVICCHVAENFLESEKISILAICVKVHAQCLSEGLTVGNEDVFLLVEITEILQLVHTSSHTYILAITLLYIRHRTFIHTSSQTHTHVITNLYIRHHTLIYMYDITYSYTRHRIFIHTSSHTYTYVTIVAIIC